VPTVAFHVYFVGFGLVMVGLSLALLTNFRGFGRRWEEELHRQTTAVIKVARLPWTANPAEGRVWRPFVGIFGVTLGVVLTLIGLFASR